MPAMEEYSLPVHTVKIPPFCSYARIARTVLSSMWSGELPKVQSKSETTILYFISLPLYI